MPFPTNPTNNQTYNDGTYTYRYSTTFRSWTKIAQTISNVSNVVTSNSNITTGNTTITGSNLSVGNTVLTTSNVSVGNTTITNSNVTVGNTVISNNELTGNLANGNTSISIPSANGNVAFSAGGTSNVFVVSSDGTNITGSANITGNTNSGNLNATGVLSVTGNANVGNIGANNAVFTGSATFGANISLANFNITNLAEPVASTDAATKAYVDSIAEGLHTHDSCNVATPDTLANISSGTITYNNGSNGIGATLTTTGSYTTIDGVALLNGMRILVKNEANSAHNGIYDRTSTTVITRSSDFDTPAEMAGGDFTFVSAGTLYDNTGWVMTDPVTTVGTSPVPWAQFSGAGTYTAGTGLTLTGTQFSVNASQTQITSVGTLSDLTVSGNIGVANITATGNITAANFVGIFANGNTDIRIPAANGNINIDVGGSTDEVVITSTGVNVAGYLTVTGDLTAANFVGIFANGNSDIRIPVANGNINIDVGGSTDEVVITSTGVNVAGYLTATGNITGNNLTSTRIITRTANNGATTSGTITPNADTSDQFNLIGISGTTTIAAPSGTFTDGQKLTIRIKDDGTTRTLNWTTGSANSYRVIGVTLPTSTTASKVSYIGCVYNSQDSFWDVVAVTTQA